MNKRIAFIGFLAFLSLAGTAIAADVTGKWTAAVEDNDLVMVFKAKGDKLKGSIENPLLGNTKIKDGKIDGDTISFLCCA